MNRIQIIQLVTLRGAVKMEKAGMKRSRSPSAKTLAIVHLGLGTRATHDEVIEALTKRIEEGEKELANASH